MQQPVFVSKYDFDQLLESVTQRVNSHAYDAKFCVEIITQALELHVGLGCGISNEQLNKVTDALRKSLEA